MRETDTAMIMKIDLLQPYLHPLCIPKVHPQFCRHILRIVVDPLQMYPIHDNVNAIEEEGSEGRTKGTQMVNRRD